MSKQRTKHIKVYRQHKKVGNFAYFAWDRHTDEYSWAHTAAKARKDVEDRNTDIRISCKLGNLNNFVHTLQKMI